MSPRPIPAALAALPFVLVLAGCGPKAPEAAPRSTAAPAALPDDVKPLEATLAPAPAGGSGDGPGGRARPSRPRASSSRSSAPTSSPASPGPRGAGPRRRGAARVRKGQPLLTLETDYLKLDVARAEADLARARGRRPRGRGARLRAEEGASSRRSSVSQAAFDRSQAAFEAGDGGPPRRPGGASTLARQRLSDAVLALADRRCRPREAGRRGRAAERGDGHVRRRPDRAAQAPLPRARALPRRRRASAQTVTRHGRPVPGQRRSTGPSRSSSARPRPREPDVPRRGDLPEPRRAAAARALRPRRARRADGPAVRPMHEQARRALRPAPRLRGRARPRPRRRRALLATDRLGVDRFPKIDFPFVTITHPPRRRGAGGDRDRGHRQDRGGGQHDQRHRPAHLDLGRGRLQVVIVQFVLEKDADVAAQEVRDRVNTVLRDLPARRRPAGHREDRPRRDARPLGRRSPAPRPIRDVTEFADKMLRRAARVGPRRRPGHASSAAARRQINVVVDPAKLAGLGLTAAEVVRALSDRRTSQLPGGTRRAGPARPDAPHLRPRRRRPRSFGDDPDRRTGTATPVRVADVARSRTAMAEVGDARERQRQARRRPPGPQAVGHEHDRGRRAAEGAPRRACGAQLPKGWTDSTSCATSPSTSSPRSTRSRSTSSSGRSSPPASSWFFLRKLRPTLIAAIAIPTSLIATFAAMRLRWASRSTSSRCWR